VPGVVVADVLVGVFVVVGVVVVFGVDLGVDLVCPVALIGASWQMNRTNVINPILNG
jgi:hypothetical protein